MKKILATVIGVLCFYNSVILSACNDINVSNGTSSFTRTESSSSGNEILTDEPPMPEDERPVIEIGSGTQPFTKERTENILLRNIPKTNTVFDYKKFDITLGYSNANLTQVKLETNNIDNVFAFFDGKCRKFSSERNGVLILPNVDDIPYWDVTYSITHKVQYVGENDKYNMYDTFNISCNMKGYIRFPDGREYYTIINYSPLGIMEEIVSGIYWGYDFPLRYICYDGDAFLTKSYISFPQVELGTANPDTTHCEFGLYYQSADLENPYRENMYPTNLHYYYCGFSIGIYDAGSNNEGNNPKLTEEESALAFGQIYETIKDSFIVYDYEYYKTQFDGEKNG